MTAAPAPPPVRAGGGTLYAVIAISGASVLAIEILGTRILGPFYGVSLFLWSALISVTLAGLSLGYALGGRWADRGPRAARLALLLACAGLWLLAVPWLRHPLLAATDRLGLRIAVLATAFLLFFPPLTLLGMVTPYAIRLRAERLEEVGRTAGDLFAISTIASVAAAILTGFWLIPSFGVTRLTLSIGVLLLLAALLAALAGTRAPARRTGAVLSAALLGAGLARITPADARLEEGLKFVGQSPYAEIRVLDRREARFLLIDGGAHTIIRVGTYEPFQEYVVVTELARELFPGPGDLLLVGLGGGAVAKSFAREGWRVDAVEIDPLVIRIAREWFHLEPTEANVHYMDGRRFLASGTGTYDLIVLDAFGSSSIPFHLVTVESFGLAKARLREGGVLAVNVETVGWKDPLVAGLAASMEPHFRTVLALPIAEPPDRLGNLVLFASDRILEIPEHALGDPVEVLDDGYRHWRVIQRVHAWDNRFTPVTAGLAPLTDDRNPVDVWAESVNRAARRKLHDLFGEDGGSW